MKPLSSIASKLCLSLVAVTLAAGLLQASGTENTLSQSRALMWQRPPTEASEWYWMYDDASSPPFEYPVLPPMPAPPYSQYSIVDRPFVSKLAPYNDRTWGIALSDSFWYYGQWYKPGDKLCISPDGWVSFDVHAEGAGAPNPPPGVSPIPNVAVPNELIAVLWSDYDPTRDPEPSIANRVYYLYDQDARSLTVEWYKVESHSSGSVYTFQLNLRLGGQLLLDTRGSCGAVYSRHHVQFIYNASSAGWYADNGKTGIENQSGTKGIFYQGMINTAGDNFHVVRAGFKRTFKHDVQATQFLSPGPMVLRWTEHEPIVVVSNVGTEEEHFTVTLDIYDDEDSSLVYHHNLGSYNLVPGAHDTLAAPCWTPGELTIDPYHTYTKKLYTSLATDECRINDTLVEASWVGCDDTLGYGWNFGDASPGPPFSITDTMQWTLFFEANGGILATGGRIYLETGSWSNSGPWGVGLWQAENGCGLPEDPPYVVAPVEFPPPDGPCAGWVVFKWGLVPVFVPASNPGNIWAGAFPKSNSFPALFGMYGLRNYGRPMTPCFQGERAPTAYRHNGVWYWDYEYSGGWPWRVYYVPVIELITHLSPAAKPAPPCYYDEPHDLTCYEMRNPDDEYIEAGVALNPEMAIANIGRQAEPDAGFFPVKFLAYIEDELDYEDSTLINAIGWLGNAADNPDTLMVALDPWTPKSVCKDYVSEEDGPFVFYDLIGLVRLGEVGPDESDHCPYNDTVKLSLVSLWSHDVGVIDLQWPEEPDSPPDHYDPGSTITATATVENFGYNSENNVPVRLEVRDVDSNVLLWNNVQQIAFLDWRGNTLDNPFVADVTFPPYVVLNEHHFTMEARTELEGDQCPDDDFCVRWTDIIEGNRELPTAYYLDLANGTIKYDVPEASRVKLDVYDINGRWIKTIENDLCQPGRYTRTWDGQDNAGRKAAAGIYFVRMEAEGFNAAKKLVLVK